MKISVTPVFGRPELKRIVTPLLAALLFGCSTSGSKDDAQVPSEPRTGGITAAAEARPAVDQQAVADSIKVTHPRTYTVKKGDTLWDISSLFLKDPWYWPEIWHQNQQVANPHLIYPGDILTLIYVDGMPRIVTSTSKPVHGAVVTDDEGALPVVKLSPSIRTRSIEASIDSIPGDAIRQFLSKPRVVTKDELDAAPYILGSDDEHLILAQGNQVYIRGEIDKERVRYTIVRKGDKLIDPDTDDLLGYEAIYAGEVLIHTYGDPAIGELLETKREVLIGDHLLPVDKSKIDNLYFPRLPDSNIYGRIVHLPDALFGVAKLQIVVVNKGGRDGIESGHLLATYTKGEHMQDRFDNTEIDMPDIRSGLVMVFRSFEHVSYALVLESSRVIHNGDIVKTPK